MNASSIKKPTFRDLWPSFGLLVVLGAELGVPAGQVMAQDTGSYRVAGPIAAYLGMMPAEIIAGHPAGHPEALMHGGFPAGPYAEHIVVALFEDPSGTRIENAAVSATVSGLGHIASTQVTLEPMLIAGVITYGGYVTLPGPDTYSIDLQISRPDSPTKTRISFSYKQTGN